MTPIPKLDKTPSPDFACVENGRWLCDKTIDEYHQLLLSEVVDKMAHILANIFNYISTITPEGHIAYRPHLAEVNIFGRCSRVKGHFSCYKLASHP